MAAPSTEPRNPFYLLLLLTSILFVVTVLAVALVPLLEEKAWQAGQPPPPSPFRKRLSNEGWMWLLWEVAAMIVFGFLSMAVDRLRSLQKQRAEATIPPKEPPPSPP